MADLNAQPSEADELPRSDSERSKANWPGILARSQALQVEQIDHNSLLRNARSNGKALTFCFFCVKAKEKDSLKIELKSDRKPRLQKKKYAALTFCFFSVKRKEKENFYKIKPIILKIIINF